MEKMEKYQGQVKVLDGGIGSWSSDSARESAWNNFCYESARFHWGEIEAATDFRGLLFHVRKMYEASSGAVTQKTTHFQQEVISCREVVGEGAAAALAKIVVLMSGGMLIPQALLELIPQLQKDRLWAEEVKINMRDFYIIKSRYSTAWRLQLGDGDEAERHPFYISALGANPELSSREFGPEGDRTLEVFFQVGRWRFGTERHNGVWSPWRRMLRREGDFSPEPGFNTRQGDCFFATPPFYGVEIPQGEGQLLEGVPELLRNVQFVRQSDGSSIAVKEVREYPDFYKTTTRYEEVSRPAYRVELDLGLGVGDDDAVGVTAFHRDHGPVEFCFRDGDGGNMLWAAEGRGETDYRPRDNGGD